jgi:hypothetical protein
LGVVDDVLEGDVNRFVAEFHREDLIRFVAEGVEELGVDSCRFLSDKTGKCCALRPVPLAGCAQLPNRWTRKAVACSVIRRQLEGALVEVIGDAHRANGV